MKQPVATCLTVLLSLIKWLWIQLLRKRCIVVLYAGETSGVLDVTIFLDWLIDWLMIVHNALFSALLSRLTALTRGSAWVTSFTARFLNIHRSGVLTALAWLVPHETAAVSAHVLCTPYNHAPCHFMQSHIRNVYACLAVTCHLHLWQNDRDLLPDTVVESAQKVDPGEKILPPFQ